MSQKTRPGFARFSRKLLAPLCLWAAGSIEAQTAAALLRGTVLDPARSTMPGIEVVVSPKDKGAAQCAITGPDGTFAIPLPPGAYTVRIAVQGFALWTSNVEWKANEAAPPLEAVLQLGGSREVVTVIERGGYLTRAASSLKTTVPLLDVPQSVAVVNRSLIRDLSMQNMADVVRYVPGITMAQGEGHRDAPVIRGNATTADFFVNGVRDDVQYIRDLYNVERVEAIKGANALTFGRGGGGGILNRVTKQAEFFPVRELSLQGGTYGNRRGNADFGHQFGDRVAIRLNTLYENSDSFRHDVNLERYGIAPAVSFKPDTRTLLRFNYEYFHDGRVVDRGVSSVSGLPMAIHRSTFFGDPGANYSRAGVHLGSASLERQFGGWLLRNTTMVGDYDKFYQNVFPGAVNVAQAAVSISGYHDATGRRNFFNQTDWSGGFSTGALRHTLLIGSEFGRQSTANFRNTAFFGTATSILTPLTQTNRSFDAVFRQTATSPDNSTLSRIAAVFVQDQIHLNRFVQIVTGLRFDAFRLDYNNRRVAGERLNRPDNLISPRLGLVLKPAAAVSLYASYSVSCLPSAGDQFTALTATAQSLRPERFNNYEAGAKWDAAKRLSITGAVYRLDRNNSVSRDPNNPAVLLQTGSQRSNGVEISANGSLTSRWQITGGYAVQKAFISSPTTAAVLGALVPLVPRYSLSLWNNYNVRRRFGAGLGLIRQSMMWAGIDNTVRLPGFTRADAAVFYRLSEFLHLQANLENATNVNYFPTAHSNTNILPGSPRALRVGLTARF
ncbi:MAG: TonB-dependent siderophore receptor [Acidobacteria bacterium]|nr:TonB-dependent siderophore receptor [Acidobacteriota bacterium]